ncbi:MAG: hypothetical protein AB7E81_14735 [Hyphomicrobiaceae bacterium]
MVVDEGVAAAVHRPPMAVAGAVVPAHLVVAVAADIVLIAVVVEGILLVARVPAAITALIVAAETA